MTETPAPASIVVRKRPPVSDLLRWVFGALIILALGFWLIG